MILNMRYPTILAGFGALLLIGLACALPAIPAGSSGTDCSSEAFIVTVDLDISDGECDENCSLREAITAANTCPGPNRIHLGTGTINLAAAGPGDERGDLNIHDDLTIVGEGEDASVIRSSTFRAFSIDEGVAVSMQDLTIQGSNESGDGGGILNAGNLTLENVALRGNAASGDGGAIFNSGTLNLSHVVVDGNRAGRGGGILNTGEATLSDVQITSNSANVAFPASEEFDVHPHLDRFADCGGGINNQGTMVISASQVSYNWARLGGGICNQYWLEIYESDISWNPNDQAGRVGQFREIRSGGGIVNYLNLIIDDTNIQGNSARSGGGIMGLMLEGGSVWLEDSNVSANRATNGNGGGLYILAGDYHLIHNVYADNRADSGGGVYINKNFEFEVTRLNVDISQSAIIRNQVTRNGGGIYHGGGNAGTESALELVNTTISGNQAQNGGGVYESSGPGGSTRFWHVTIADNHAAGGTGGGVYFHDFSGAVYFKNTLIATNTFWECASARGHAPSVVSEGGNIDQEDLCHFSARAGDLNRAGDGVGLMGLTEDMGTYVHMLLPTSPAVDWISSEECAGIDQRGLVRPIGLGCDAGAFELDLMATSGTFSPDDLATVTPTPGGTTPQPPVTVTPSGPPAAPANLAANTSTCSDQDYAVTLLWFDAASNEVGFKILRDGVEIATVGANISQYVDHPPYSGPHTYQVIAYNGGGEAASGITQDSGCIF